MQHYIVPAAETALDLQQSLHRYIKNFDNPLVQQRAVELASFNQHELMAEHLYNLMRKVEYFKFCLSVAVRRDTRPEAQQMITQLWDQLDRFGHAHDLSEYRRFQDDSLKQWIAEVEPVVERASRTIKVHKHTLRAVSKPTQMPEQPVVFTQDVCQKIIKALLEDELATRMNWRRRAIDDQSNLQRVMLDVFPQWDGLDERIADGMPTEHAAVWRDEAVKCCGHLVRSVIEPFQKRVASWLDQVIPETTWQVWNVRPHGSDLQLVGGKDWRISDWERRMASGEWKMEDAPASATVDPEFAKVEALTNVILDNSQKRRQSAIAAGMNPDLIPEPLNPAPIREVFKVAAKANPGKKRRD